MKIALIAPTLYTVPPIAYGGIEMFLYDLMNAYNEMGVDATLFAPIGSTGKFKVIETVNPGASEMSAYFVHIKDRLDEFDIIQEHSHEKWALSDENAYKTVTFLHGIQANLNIYNREKPCLVAESKYHAELEAARFMREVEYCYPGVDLKRYKFRRDKGDFYLHLGLIIPRKGAHVSIHWARKLGFKLIIAGEDRMSPDRAYVDRIIRLCARENNITYLGRVSHREKIELLSSAKAVLLPSLTGEAFSLIAVEALASGTPVITFNLGAMPEIIEDGRHGFLCNNLEEFGEAIKKADEINPDDCLERASLFDIRRTAEEYLKLCEKAMSERW